MSEQTLADMPIEGLLNPDGIKCHCGKIHLTPLQDLIVGPNVLSHLIGLLKSRNVNHPFVVSDINTYQAAGEAVCKLLSDAGISYTSYTMDSLCPTPSEYWVGAAAMRCTKNMDGIIAVGSGTINDICKIISCNTKLPYIIVGTAPSMDGYASDTSSMVLSGLKVSIASCCPGAIIADTAIMAKAPMPMLQAGLGDMAAKYTSICEWRISHLITGEYYCENIASLIRKSLKQCVDCSDRLAERDPEVIGHIVNGLILSGISMGFAGISRPASGTEHYFSHIWDMTALECGYEHHLHGIQCGVSTLLTLKVFDYIKTLQPDRQKALDYVNHFTMDEWEAFVRCLFGSASGSIISREKEEQKFSKAGHEARLEKIINSWDQILCIMEEELPSYDWLREKLKACRAPVDASELNLSAELVRDSFLGTKDIRKKYISTHLLWDLGMLDEAAAKLF